MLETVTRPPPEPLDLPHPGRAPDERLNWKTSWPMLLVHVLPLFAVFTGVTVRAVVLCVALYVLRVFFITAGYHRYFSHRSYKLARVPQFLMAFGGTMAAQKGPLWWAAHHRDHHRWSDTSRDIHSPQRGFWWSHMGWIVCDKYNGTDLDRIRDFAKYPEIRWIDKHNWIGPWVLGVASFLIAGLPGLFVGFFLSQALSWHATFFINSLAHVFGRRRFATEDTSRNSFLLAVVTMGEGWHNNHHYYQASARQGFYWWEWDPSFYVLRALSWVGIVKGLKTPPERVLQADRIRDGVFDIGMFKAHLNKASQFVEATEPAAVERVAVADAPGSDGLAARRRAVEQGLQAKKERLEGFVSGSLASAEELARSTRRGERELGLLES